MKSLKDPDMSNTVESIEVDELTARLDAWIVASDAWLAADPASEAVLLRDLKAVLAALQASEAARLKAEGERDFYRSQRDEARAGEDIAFRNLEGAASRADHWQEVAQAAELRASKAEADAAAWKAEAAGEFIKRQAAEEQRKALVEALERIRAATPASTNSATIAQFQSWVRAVADAALSETADQALPKDGWQPIESAPRDGTLVLLWAPDYREDAPSLGSWCERVGAWDADSGTMEDGPAWSNDACSGPTHWMPLPAPPTTKGEGE
jgi:hypothetical protein